MSYDLLMLSGIRNLIWRTPGTDGGRDLEGIHSRMDFSGGVVSEKWYFECKRYAASIPWPTVFEKVSYASNHMADYLLFLSTSSFSPHCEDEVARWNAARQHPKIRHWPGHHLAELLVGYPKLQMKYGLAETPAPAPASMFQISFELAKAVQASYAAEEFRDGPRAPTEFAAALADQMTACIGDLEAGGGVTLRHFRDNATDGFPWLKITGRPPTSFDRMALRSLLTALRLTNRNEEFEITGAEQELSISLANKSPLVFGSSLDKVIHEICFWGNLEIIQDGNHITVTRRT